MSGWTLPADGASALAETIQRTSATILIGLSTVAGAFDELLVREMARKTERPIIFPLSNPTDRSEATAENLVRWTGGRGLVATGSPFAPVEFEGKTYPNAQCNNVFIFPAVGLGVVASKARRVTDGMMIAAAKALGEASPALRDPSLPLLPSIRQLLEVANNIAFAVGRETQRAGVAEVVGDDELRASLEAAHWTPEYAPYEPVSVL